MAQKAKKDRAKANITTLNYLHIGSLIFNGLFIIFNFLIKSRSLVVYAIFSVPCFIAEYILETTGRPRYDPTTKALKSSGEDLAAVGLTEYLFDVIWITWFSLVAVIAFGNWGWVVWAVVPIYGVYKGYGLLGIARGMMGGGQGASAQENTAPAVGNRRQRRTA